MLRTAGLPSTKQRRRDVLKTDSNKGPVFHIRDVEEIVTYLGAETVRPASGEPIEDVYHRRAPWYAKVCNYEFYNHIKSGPDPKAVAQEVFRFSKHVTGKNQNYPANLVQGTSFLSLTYPDQDSHEKIRAHTPSEAYVAGRLAALRLATSLPIVFTIRTVTQGGSFPDAAEAEGLELFDLAICAGVEYVDVEISWSAKHVSGSISKKGKTKVIASWHDWSGKLTWDWTEVMQKCQDANRKFGDITVGKANNLEDNFTLCSFVKKVADAPGSKPVLAINMSVAGVMIDASLDWMHLHAGQVLWRAEDASYLMYIVINGRLRATTESEEGGINILGEYDQGDSVGELDVIINTPRTTTLRAVRDSELIWMPQTLFNAISSR